MHDQNFITTFLVEQTPEEVFAAINDVRGWWSEEIEGSTRELGDEFTFVYEDIHRSRQRITASIPGEKVSWHIVDACLNFTENTGEWIGTDVSFEISKKSNETEIRFTHVGLVPEFECFNACSNGWNYYVNGSLRSLITSGKGQPNERVKDDVVKTSL